MGAEAAFAVGHFEVADMGDKGVETGAAFGLIDRGDGGWICRVTRQTIDGFSGQTDKAAAAQGLCCARDCGGCGRQDLRHHGAGFNTHGRVRLAGRLGAVFTAYQP